MTAWTPADWIKLIEVLFYGVTILCVPAATFFTMISALRIKAVSENVAMLEKNTNSISERNEAIAMKLGITEGIAQERASVQANADNAASASPLPVADDRTAVAAERSAAATERVADAAEKPTDSR